MGTVKPRDVGLVLLGALLGVGIALLVRSAPRTASPSSDRSDEVAALERRVEDLQRRLADRPPALAAAPRHPDASATSEESEAKDATKPPTRSKKDARPPTTDGTAAPSQPPGVEEFVRFGTATAGGGSPVFVLSRERPEDLGPAPTVAEIPRLLESSERTDVQRALREIGRSRLREFLPTLTDLVNRPERRGDASTFIHTIADLKDRSWSPVQATGAPDTPIDGDLGTAWASKRPEMGIVTLDLEYDRAVRVDGVRVHETLAPGALVRIEVRGPDGAWEAVWSGEERPGPSPWWSEPPIRPTYYSTNAIRLVIDTDRVPGWNEIDAVELVGDGLRQWAARATASSSYSDP